MHIMNAHFAFFKKWLMFNIFEQNRNCLCRFILCDLIQMYTSFSWLKNVFEHYAKKKTWIVKIMFETTRFNFWILISRKKTAINEQIRIQIWHVLNWIFSHEQTWFLNAKYLNSYIKSTKNTKQIRFYQKNWINNKRVWTRAIFIKNENWKHN